MSCIFCREEAMVAGYKHQFKKQQRIEGGDTNQTAPNNYMVFTQNFFTQV